VVDEAHALGVVGPDGTGTAPLLGLANGSPGLVLTGSLSKAIGGASGGFVAGSHAVIEQLQAYCRGWIFTMGMTTANAATAMAALNVCRTDLSLRERLWANLSHVHDALRACGVPCFASDSAIIALRIGDEERASRVSAALRHDCVYAPAVGYPIVGRGEARLRLQISAAHEVADLDRAVAAIAVLINGSRQ
jgi:7-keto-8-aminopelargonate synthetase-like enzyme